MSEFFEDELDPPLFPFAGTQAHGARQRRAATDIALKPISLLPGGIEFRAHEFADQWLSQWGLSGDAQIQVTYQEVENVDAAAQARRSAVALRDAVTQGFLRAHQSRDVASASDRSPRDGWTYPHISQMSVDFSSLKVAGTAVSQSTLRQLRVGIAPNYQGTGLPANKEGDAQKNLLSAQEKEQIKQLGLLDTHQAKLARLFAGVPTFDSVMKNLLVTTLKEKIPARKFRASLLQQLDPDTWYVNRFTTDDTGERSLSSSQSFTSQMWDCLLTDTPPTYTAGGVGFFTAPDAVEDSANVFINALDVSLLRAMESVFYIPRPTTNARVKHQCLEDLRSFGDSQNTEDALQTPGASTTAASLAHLLSRRFLHLHDLYKADRNPATALTESARTQQQDEDRLLDLISTHPAQADRNRLMRAPVPRVYAVMLDMGAGQLQRWPAAMVIKQAEPSWLFLYSLEGGIQRFHSFSALVASVRPVHEGQERTIRNITVEQPGHVFETAADELLQVQTVALEKMLGAPGNETVALRIFAQNMEDALDLPMLSLAGAMVVRQETLIGNYRPDCYRTATPTEQANYRALENKVVGAVYQLGEGLQTLVQFTQQKVKQYLRQTVHPGIDPDPERTMVTLSYGAAANPRQSRTASLTQLMLDNLRPDEHPNAMKEVSTLYLINPDGQRTRHPASGYFVTLTGGEVAKMVTTLDAGANYERWLRAFMNKPDYRSAWHAAYLANMTFQAYEAGLKGNQVFKATVLDNTSRPPASKKHLALWLEAVLMSPHAQKRPLVMGRKVHVYGLLLGGSVGIGGLHARMTDAVSVDGALVICDQEGPELRGTVAVYLPDSPDGEDIHEFDNLGNGVAALLQRAQWRAYFRSRISTSDAQEMDRALGLRGGRPLIRGWKITGNFVDELWQSHINFQSAYADHRSNSNADIRRRTYARTGLAVFEGFADLAGTLFLPGIQVLRRVFKTGMLVVRTGKVPLDLDTLAFVHRVANHGGLGLASGGGVSARGQSSFLAMTARQAQGEGLAGLGLERAIYGRYAVTDTSVIRGVSADAQGFYRTTIMDLATGSVRARAVYIQQPDKTVFRVHDHTKRGVTEANLVDPVTGLGIRSSGVMRSTVARMADGEWRAVGFGQGGGKRAAPDAPQPGPSKPKVPAVSPASISNAVRTAGSWNSQIMDLVPSIITRIPSWPQNRSLLIMDDTAARSWSVRFTPGQEESIYPLMAHPGRSRTDIVLRRRAQNHYDLMLEGGVVEIPADGDCFFTAVARGLNEGQAQQATSMQGLRDAVADHIDRLPQVRDYLAPQPTALQQALFDNAPPLEPLLGDAALLDLTQIVFGGPNEHGLFQPTLDYLRLCANRAARNVLFEAREGDLPPELLQQIGRVLSPREPARLGSSSPPYSVEQRQSMQHFFEDVLLGPVQAREVTELLNNKYLLLSRDTTHILLEYGVSARQLSDHHPNNESAFVLYDQALHSHLDEDQLEELLDGAYLVDRNDLDELAERIETDIGETIDDDAELFEQFKYYQETEDTVALLRAALERYPALLRRANIVLASDTVASHLGGMLSVDEFAAWIRNPALSDRRLGIFSTYTLTRYNEIVEAESIAIDWMRPFDDDNLGRIVTHHDVLAKFVWFLEDEGGDIGAFDMSAIARLFSAAGQPPSNSRVALLFEFPGVWAALQRFPRGEALQIWNDLIGPHFSDHHIRQTIRQRWSLRSTQEFSAALTASLDAEEARANRIVQDVLSIGQSRAQQYLHNFVFPNHRLGHSRLNFVIYLQEYLQVPEWAWLYVRSGVTPDSLKTFWQEKTNP